MQKKLVLHTYHFGEEGAFQQFHGYCREHFAESHNRSKREAIAVLFTRQCSFKKSNSICVFRLVLSHPEFLIIFLHKTVQSKDDSVRAETSS